MLQHDARLLDEVIKRENYNKAVADAHAEAENWPRANSIAWCPKPRYSNTSRVRSPSRHHGLQLPTRVQKTFMFMNPFVHGGKNIPVLRALSQGTTFGGILHTMAMHAGADPEMLTRW